MGFRDLKSQGKVEADAWETSSLTHKTFPSNKQDSALEAGLLLVRAIQTLVVCFRTTIDEVIHRRLDRGFRPMRHAPSIAVTKCTGSRVPTSTAHTLKASPEQDSGIH